MTVIRPVCAIRAVRRGPLGRGSHRARHLLLSKWVLDLYDGTTCNIMFSRVSDAGNAVCGIMYQNGR